MVLSTRATVPALTGKTKAEADEALERLGAVVQIREVYKPGTTPGTVVAVEPPAGGPLRATMVLDVSAPPSSVFLTALDSIEGNCQTGTANAGATSSTNAVTCTARSLPSSSAPDPTLTYDLAGRADRFTATVGIPNDDEPGSRARVRVVVDGQERFNQVIVTGANVAIDVPISGGGRLDLYVTEPNIDDPSWDGSSAAFLDARVLGSRRNIDALAAS